MGLARHVSKGAWIPAPHLILLNEAALDLVAGREEGLIEELPVRHGKSEFTSKYLPAWYLGRFPKKRVGLASYEADFAATWGRKVRDILEEHGEEIFGVRVSPSNSAAHRWDVQYREGNRWVTGGGMFTSGVGGPMTGMGFDLLIVDDPFKNAQEANSKTRRDHVWEWFTSVALTRVEPGGVVIVIQSRWHEDDLIGRLKKHQGDGEETDGRKYRVIHLPAIAEEDDILGREAGEALFPERYPIEQLMKLKKDVGPYYFSALYQGTPRPPDGTVFKRQHFRYFTLQGDMATLYREDGIVDRFSTRQCWRFQTIDPSASEKDTADFFVITTFLVTPRADLLVENVFRLRIEGAEQKKLIAQMYRKYHPVLQGVEVKAMGLTLFQECRNMGLPVYELKAETDKVIRAQPVAARMEAHTVFFREGAHWLEDFEDELVAFPKGANDDQVDTLSYGGISLADVLTKVEGEDVIVAESEVYISPV